MKNYYKELGVTLVLALLVLMPTSGSLRGGSGAASLSRMRLFRAPVAEEQVFVKPEVNTPLVEENTILPKVTEDSKPIESEANVKMDPPSEPFPSVSDLPAVVKEDNAAVDRAVKEDEAAKAHKPVMQKMENTNVERVEEDGSLDLNLVPRAIDLIKKAPKITFSFIHSEDEHLGISKFGCAWFSCDEVYWRIGAYVDVSPDDPYLQAELAREANYLKLVIPEGIQSSSFKKIRLAPKGRFAGVTLSDHFFGYPIPVLDKAETAISSPSLDYYIQYLGFDGKVLSVPFSYISSYGNEIWDSHPVLALVHGQKLYIQGNWETTTDENYANSRDQSKVSKYNVCSTGSSSLAKKTTKSKLQVFYAGKQLAQSSVKKNKDGTCAAIYLIP